MRVLECKTCGGHVLLVSDVLGQCESCGRTVTLPRVREDVQIEFYNRANQFRNWGEFDRAYSDFQHIIAQDSFDAEAYWSLCMCKYGVIYRKDLQSGQYQMVASRVRQEPIWEDMDYLSTLRNCDEDAKPHYRADARQIDEFVEDYFAFVRSEKPYDVFLGVRYADAEGKKTRSGEVAETVCQKLREKQLRVYCPWEAPGEAHAVFALDTAKLMFAVVTEPEELTGDDIRCYWQLFRSRCETDRNCHLIPIYSGVSLESLPVEIPTHQAVCADLPGWWQDMSWGAMQLLGKQKAPAEAEEDGISAEDFVKEARKSFEMGNLSAAGLMAEQALNYDANHAYAHYYLLMSKHNARKIEDLYCVPVNWETSTALNRIIELDKGELAEKLTVFRTEYCNRRDYQAARNYMAKEEYGNAITLLQKLIGFADSEKVLAECKKLHHHQITLANYRKETENDPMGHLYRVMQQKHGDQVEVLQRKINRVFNAPREKHSHVLALVCSIIMLILGLFVLIINATDMEGMDGVDSFIGVFYILVAAAYGFGVMRSVIQGVVFVFLGYLCISSFITEPYDGVENIALSVLPFLTFLVNFRKEAFYKKSLKELNTYEQTVITPLEQAILADLKNRYGSVLTDGEMGSFSTVRSIWEQEIQNQRVK